MQTSFTDQINAIKAVMSNWTPDSNMYKALNDAASTIASLNLTKGLPKEEISDNDFEYLLDLFESHIEASDPEEEKKVKERILKFINTGESACEFCNGSGETSEPYTIHAKKRGDRYVSPSGNVFTLEEKKAFYKGLGYLIIDL